MASNDKCISRFISLLRRAMKTGKNILFYSRLVAAEAEVAAVVLVFIVVVVVVVVEVVVVVVVVLVVVVVVVVVIVVELVDQEEVEVPVGNLSSVSNGEQ